jgi:hypothetical protein
VLCSWCRDMFKSLKSLGYRGRGVSTPIAGHRGMWPECLGNQGIGAVHFERDEPAQLFFLVDDAADPCGADTCEHLLDPRCAGKVPRRSGDAVRRSTPAARESLAAPASTSGSLHAKWGRGRGDIYDLYSNSRQSPCSVLSHRQCAAVISLSQPTKRFADFGSARDVECAK